MRCAACTRNDDFQPAICRAFGIVIKPFRGAVCGHDLAFMRNIQHRHYFGGMRHGVPIGTAAHYDAEIGRAHVCTPVNNEHLVCRRLLEKKKKIKMKTKLTLLKSIKNMKSRV